MNARTSDFDASTEGRLTDEELTRFQSFREMDGDGGRTRQEGDSRSSSEYDDEPGAFRDVDPGERKTNVGDRQSITRGSALATQHAPLTLDHKSIAAAKETKKRSAKKKRKDLKLENLAHSAYQDPINAWRLNEHQEFVSDGLLRMQEMRMTDSGRVLSSGSSVVSSSAAQQSSMDSSIDSRDQTRNISVVARAGERTPGSPASHLSITPAKPRSSLRGAKPPPSPWYDIRSFLGATSTSKSRLNTSAMSASFSEEKSARSEVLSDGSSDVGSVVNHNDTDSERSGQMSRDVEAAAGDEVVDVQQRESQIQQLVRRRSRRNVVGGEVGYRPFYFLRLFLFYLRNFVLGSNVYPIGPKYIRKILELLIFVLCIGDLALAIIVLTGAYCASHDTTACSDHSSMILMITVWPGALFIAPIMGLVTVILGPSGTLARIYAMWSRIAGINSAMVVWSLLYYFNYYYNVPGSIYSMLILPSSRLVQCLLVDLYIAHIEKLRYTRGWDGLHTSLYKTQDHLQEITI
jgi:hypothetical protein